MVEVARDIIERAVGGDREALTQLWRAYQPALLRYLRGMSVRLADDVASQVWLDAGRSLRRFRGDGHDLRRWLFTIARRRMIDAYRAEGRRRDVAAGDVLPEQPADDDVAGAVLAGEGGPALDAVRRLPASQAEIVLLRVVVGFSVEEVAALTGKSPGAVRVTSHRALRQLAEILSEDQRPDPPTGRGVTQPVRPSMERST